MHILNAFCSQFQAGRARVEAESQRIRNRGEIIKGEIGGTKKS